MTDSILIVGAGIAGLTAAQKVAEGGGRAIVVERLAVAGGKLAAPMTKAKAIGNRAGGEEIPLFDALADNEQIEILTSSTLQSVEGRAGSFKVSIQERARFVTDACTRCKNCHPVCPVVLPNEFDAGLTFRKAIYTPMIQTLPEAWVIDIDACLNKPPNYLPCNRCREVCDDNAIHFDQPLVTEHERQVAAIVLAPGMQIESGAGYEELGYSAHPDVVTSAEMQRMLEAPGPSGGFATRPSNEEYPESVLIVVDDPSPFALYIASSQAHQLLEQDVERVAVLALSQPTGSEAAEQLTAETGIDVYWGAAFKVAGEKDEPVRVSFEDLSARKFIEQTYDMVVLNVEVAPPEGLAELAEVAGIPLADSGFLQAGDGNGSVTVTPVKGIFVAGCGAGPKTISESIAEAGTAAREALAQMNPILLEGKSGAADKAAAHASNDDMRAQIEKLLHALIDRPAG